MVRTIFAQPDADMVHERHARIVDQLATRFPDAAELMDEPAAGRRRHTGAMNRPATPAISQLAFCTPDLPASLRLYSEVFGFANAGVRAIWGEWLARVQDLGADAACTIGWLVGRQEMVQLEFFSHTLPKLKQQPADWRPCDHGWNRFGLTVPDFQATLARLGAAGVGTITAPVVRCRLQRVAFRDPFTGVIVELMEDGPGLPGGVRPRCFDLSPAVVYAALSVADLDQTCSFLVDTVGLVEEDPGLLHQPEDEELWGLPGATTERVVLAGAGDIYLEVVGYVDPPGRSKPDGYLLSDQGFMNVAVGYRSRPMTDALIDRIVADGHRLNAELWPTPAAGSYVTSAQGVSLEVLSAPREYDGVLGFEPQPNPTHAPRWPHTDVPAARP